MNDADDDGAHIQILLITFFYRFMKGLIENGMLYIANPPLYSIEYNKNLLEEDYNKQLPKFSEYLEKNKIHY